MATKTKIKVQTVNINSAAFEKRVQEIFSKITTSIKSVVMPKRFEKLADGWEKDLLMGIDRGPTEPKQMTQQEAMDHFAKQGYRLETDKELTSLIDRSKRNPAVVDGCQLDFKTDDAYLTSSSVVGNPGYAWVVNMHGGNVLCSHRGNRCYVRPVRASQ